MKHLILILGLTAGFGLSNVTYPVKHNEAAPTASKKLLQQVKQPSIPLAQTLPTSTVTEAKSEPALVSTPKPVVTGCEQYRSLISQYDWPVQTMMAIMRAESGCRADAVNPTNWDGVGDYGLFQIHGAAEFDPAKNIQLAYSIYSRQGLNAWTVYSSGRYLTFL